MAKRIGKRAAKKGLDQRDIIVISCYFLLFIILIFLFMNTKSGQKDIDVLKAREQEIQQEIRNVDNQVRSADMQLRTHKATLENSRAEVEKERADYAIVVGTSLEYAKKSQLLTAIWDAISRVRGLALTKVQIAKNDVNVEVLAQTDTVITEFVAELNKRRDLIDSIQPGQIEREKGAKGATEQFLTGEVKIIAKRPTAENKDTQQPEAGGGMEDNQNPVPKEVPQRWRL
jgi:F0F1-type ATP synthase membrane subunit b/b'